MSGTTDLTVPAQRPASYATRASGLLAVIDGRQPVRLVFQPIVDIRHGRVVGYEALARFGSRTSSSPAAWFTVADQLRQSAQLEALLIEQALRSKHLLPHTTFLSVNVRPDLLATPVVTRAFATQPDLTGVVIELTEQIEFDRGDVLRGQLFGLRERGAQLALDDVGAGWAGLKQVAELRPDIVKLDRSLVSAADRDGVKLALVEMMLRLCSRLGSQLLVEGVETGEELDAFARLQVPLAQGWVFGKPGLVPPRIDDDLAVRLKFLGGLIRHVDKVASLVDVTARVSRRSGPDVPWCQGIDGQVLVVLDDDSRPVGLQLRDADDRVRDLPVMTVLATEDSCQALLRGMTRPVPCRFAPLVCVDRAGRYVGLVPVDALAKAAARRDESPTVLLPR